MGKTKELPGKQKKQEVRPPTHPSEPKQGIQGTGKRYK